MSFQDDVNAQRAAHARAAFLQSRAASELDAAFDHGQAELQNLIVEAFGVLVNADAPRAVNTTIRTKWSPWSSGQRFHIEGNVVGFFLPRALKPSDHVILADGRLCRAEEFDPYRGSGLGSVPRQRQASAAVVEKFRRDHAPDRLIVVGQELTCKRVTPSSYNDNQFYILDGKLVFGDDDATSRPAREMFATWVARALDS